LANGKCVQRLNKRRQLHSEFSLYISSVFIMRIKYNCRSLYTVTTILHTPHNCRSLYTVTTILHTPHNCRSLYTVTTILHTSYNCTSLYTVTTILHTPYNCISLYTVTTILHTPYNCRSLYTVTTILHTPFSTDNIYDAEWALSYTENIVCIPLHKFGTSCTSIWEIYNTQSQCDRLVTWRTAPFLNNDQSNFQPLAQKRRNNIAWGRDNLW
jgi:hypothetical protein